uniref:Phosphatidate cytidylyltransferase n=1 Tax=Entomoneis paludosa TaxID=265537 RepID=A0A7S2YCZ8_9STRA
MTPWTALLFAVDGLSWHLVHNLLNDWQDLNDDDNVEDSFRLAYGCHVLKQGFVTKTTFLKIMAGVGVPGAILTAVFRTTALAPAALYGILALFFYTIVFKPLALGEIVIYLVWGPLMAGFGQIAAGAPWTGPAALFTDPSVALFGLSAFAMIMGKHTDKITRSNKKTLPKVLGYPGALFGCGFSIVAPHVLLAATLVKERFLCPTPTPTIPWGCALAFLTLFREVPSTLSILRLGQLRDKRQPNLPMDTQFKGTLVDGDVGRAWPLWFVAFTGWHGVTFSYLLVLGSALEWTLRVFARSIL